MSALSLSISSFGQIARLPLPSLRQTQSAVLFFPCSVTASLPPPSLLYSSPFCAVPASAHSFSPFPLLSLRLSPKLFSWCPLSLVRLSPSPLSHCIPPTHSPLPCNTRLASLISLCLTRLHSYSVYHLSLWDRSRPCFFFCRACRLYRSNLASISNLICVLPASFVSFSC